MSAYFAHPGGDALTYGAASSDPSVATVSASGSSVTITAVATGSATIHVTATDPGGLSAMGTFEATVPNRAPEPTGAIPDLAVHVGGLATIDVSSNPAVAVVSVSGSEATISAAS